MLPPKLTHGETARLGNQGQPRRRRDENRAALLGYLVDAEVQVLVRIDNDGNFRCQTSLAIPLQRSCVIAFKGESFAEMHGIVEKACARRALIADKRPPNRSRDLLLRFLSLSLGFLGGSDHAAGGKKHQSRNEKVPHLSPNSKPALRRSVA